MSTFPPIDPQTIQYPPIGRCIYCGADGGSEGLGDEHIVPYSLGATAVLPKVSCRACEAVTSYLDGYLARSVFYDLRLHMGVRSRRKQPTTRVATISDGQKDQDVEFALADHPHFIHMPIWSRAGIMLGDQPTAEFNEQALATFFDVPDNFFEKNGLSPDSAIKSVPKINLPTFARAIAKTAYAATVAHLGGLDFRPLHTPGIILGTYPYIPHFVGAEAHDQNQPPDRAHLRHKLEYGLWEFGRLSLVRVTVRLFADCGTITGQGMPTYEVIVGALRGDDAKSKFLPDRVRR